MVIMHWIHSKEKVLYQFDFLIFVPLQCLLMVWSGMT